MRGLWLRVLRLLRWQASEREIDEELRFHVEMEAEMHRRAGVDPGEARRRALIALGGRDRWREEVRAARGTAWIEDAVRDVRVAARGLLRTPGFAAPVRPAVYGPLGQGAPSEIELLVRTAGDPLSLARPVRRVIHEIDAGLPVSVRTLEQALADQLAPRRFVSWLLGIFALAALTLAAIGIFGVMAYVVGRRTREIGIRVALGAARPRLLFDVLREGMLHAVAGLVLGALASLGLTHLVRSQLFGLEATDPATFAAASVVLLAAAALACALPARRAAAVDAMVALREE